MFLRKKRSDKPKQVKFLLQPRPQRDPLAADYEAPPNVLIPQGEDADIQQISQRLHDIDPKLFASEDETKRGMLERAHAADGMHLDHDIMTAMSKDFDFDDPQNILDDNFLEQAGGFIEDDDHEFLDEEVFDADDLLSEDGPHVEIFQFKNMNPDGTTKIQSYVPSAHSNKERDEFDDDDDCPSEAKTVFTNYSLTSSVMRRNEGLQQIDEHFERLFEKEYADDTEIGPLDLNEVKGEELLSNIDQIRQLKKEVKIVRKRNHGDDYEPEIVSDHHKNAIIGDDSGEEDQDLVDTEIVVRENKIDCESILTYNSNLYNHPKLIVEARKKNISQSGSDHMDIDGNSDIDARSTASKSMASTRASVVSKLSSRPPNESQEDRRARKKALKEFRRERRQEKKQNQQIFKTEHNILIKQQRLNQPALKLA